MTTRNNRLAIAMALAVAALFGVLAQSTFAQEQTRPNILYIMSDDHCSQAIGAYGSRLAPLNPTPTIDTLAKEGMLFENCFCTNSICTPSRACVITGQYNHINGVHDLGGRVEPENQYLAIEMRKAGYQTAMIGKWHLKVEPNFDYYCVLPGQGSYFNPQFRVQGDQPFPQNVLHTEGHSSDRITDQTLEWLKNRDRSKPFFLMHHYKAPHDFFENAPRYDEYLADIDIPEPENLWTQPNFGSLATRGHNDENVRFIGTSIGPRHAFRNYTKQRKWAEEDGIDVENSSDEELKHAFYNAYLKRYLRCVKGVDDNLARLFDYMKEEGIFDNTVIIYTGDQGFMLGEHDYQDKRWMYEESQRMPFLVRYPKAIPAGSRNDVIIENVDFGPTMLDFAGIETPERMQGRSFKQVCEGQGEPQGWKDCAYYRYWMHMAHHWNPAHVGIRTKDYKLIYYYGCNYAGQAQTPPAWELYDLRKDPTEVNNVYDDPAYADVVKEMKAKFAKRRAEIGDDDRDFPELAEIVKEFWDYDEADRAKAIEISHEYNARERAKLEGRSQPKPPGKDGGAKLIKPNVFIKTAESNAPIREYKGYREISRTAEYCTNAPGPASFNVDNAYLMDGIGPRVKGHAFHCPENAEAPHIVVRLEKPATVRYIEIGNRTNGLQERAEGLTVWTSLDGKTWNEAWKAEKIEKKWMADLGQETPCQFIKIGLPRQGTLHLSTVAVFGK